MTHCRACGQSLCGHPDPIYHGVIPPPKPRAARATLSAAPCRPTGGDARHAVPANLSAAMMPDRAMMRALAEAGYISVADYVAAFPRPRLVASGQSGDARVPVHAHSDSETEARHHVR